MFRKEEVEMFLWSRKLWLEKIGINLWLFSQAAQYVFFLCVINKGEKIQWRVPCLKKLPSKFHMGRWKAPDRVKVNILPKVSSFRGEYLSSRPMLNLGWNCLCFGGGLSVRSRLHRWTFRLRLIQMFTQFLGPRLTPQHQPDAEHDV